jgi:O-antigen ligase
MSQSIAAILALVLVVSIYLYINFPKARAHILTFVTILLIIFSSVIFSKKISKSDSFFSRLEIYKAATQISSEHLLVGIGLGNFNDSFGEYIKNVPDRMNWEALHPHNIFLNYLVSLGIPGLALFLLLITKIIRRDSWQNKALYFFPFLAIILNGFIDTTFFKNDLAIIFWLFYAFLI